MKERLLGAAKFKATCLACLDEIEQSGARITITRRGRPVAVLGPVNRPPRKSPRDSWARRARITGDIMTPPAPWEVSGSA